MSIRLLLFLLFSTIQGYGQTTFRGVVSDKNGERLPQATIYISPMTTDAILAYGVTNIEGNFSITFQSSDDSIRLYASYLGYEKEVLTLAAISQEVDIKMRTSGTQLKEVVIEGDTELRQKGDTLIYRIEKFTSQDDRSVADVLSKLPGIQVDANGRIMYQGQYIEKYYIEGLDLLEGKYHLANSNMPARSVAEVQILENHQPIRALDSLVFSNKTSLNIKLKNNTQIIGTADLSVGAPPFLGKANLSPMLFNKRQQAIGSFQANNIGHDVSIQLNDNSLEELLESLEFNENKENFLNIAPLHPNGIEQTRWLNNKIYMGTINYLARLNDNTQIKSSISYFADNQSQNGSTSTSYFTKEDTISILEQKANIQSIQNLRGALVIEKNSKKLYLKNQTKYHLSSSKEQGNISNDSSLLLKQTLYDRHSAISNKFKLTLPLGENIILFQSRMFFTQAPQQLVVSPGPFENQINNELPYDSLIQNLKKINRYTFHQVTFSHKFGNLLISNHLGHRYQSELLKTNAFISNMGIEMPLDSSLFVNGTHYIQQDLFFSPELLLQKSLWSIQISMPVRWKEIKIDNINLNQQQYQQPLFEPRLSYSQKIGSKVILNSAAYFENKFDNIRRLYPAYILTNWRTLQKNQSNIFRAGHFNYSLEMSYKNIVRSLFGSINYHYGLYLNNSIYVNTVQPSAAIVQQVLAKKNQANTHQTVLNVSKYYHQIRSTVSLGTETVWSQNEQIINENIQPTKNISSKYKLGIHVDLSAKLSVRHTSEWQQINTSVGNTHLPAIQNQRFITRISYFPNKKHSLSANSDIFYSNYFSFGTINPFFDISYRLKIGKRGLSFGVEWLNLLNNTSYSHVQANYFHYSASTYYMRPQQVLISFGFTL